MTKRLHVIAFMAGLFTALMILGSLGHSLGGKNYYSGVSRFGQWLSADANHFPTLFSLLNWAEAQSSENKTFVVVGGSSIFHGVGQREPLSMPARLQGILGDNYIVLNLATRGGQAVGPGLVVASELERRGYKVWFVSDYVPEMEVLLKNDYSNYILWSAFFNEMTAAGEEIPKNLDTSGFDKFETLMFLDKHLRFVDLFNFISANVVKMNYSPFFADFSLQPLLSYPDTETGRAGDFVPAYVENDQNLVSSLWSDASSYSRLEKFRSSLEILSSFKSDRVLLVECRNAPMYTDRALRFLPSWEARISKSEQEVDNLGFLNMRGCDDLENRDYVDRVHLPESGALVLADRITKKISGFEK